MVPVIVNVNMPQADTEYSYTLPVSVKSFTIKLRQPNDLKVSFKEGESGMEYITIPAGASMSEELSLSDPLTIYFQSPVDGNVAEIVYRT